MATIHTLRPGIYSTYDVIPSFRKPNSGVAFYCGRAKTLVSSNIPAGQVVKITSVEQLESFFEADSNNIFYKYCKLLLENGVQSVYAVPITTDGSKPSNEGYVSALLKLSQIKAAGVMFCDSEDINVLSELVRLTQWASSQQRERIALAYGSSTTQAISIATSFNCERLVVCTQGTGIKNVDNVFDRMLSIASLAALVATSSPSQSFNSLPLPGVNLVSSVTESTLEELLAAGVSVLESNGDCVEIVRLVTTRTSSAGQPDRTFSSLNTVMMIDYIIGQVRSRLQFILKGYSGLSLDGIASQTAIILEENRQQGLLSQFEPPVVFKDPDDPQICTVEMEFTLASIPSQIFITAHVSL